MIMNKAKVIFKMIVVRHYLLVSFVICFVILLLFGDDFGDKEHFFQGFSCSKVFLPFFETFGKSGRKSDSFATIHA